MLLGTRKARKTCVEVAGCRTFRILTYSQQSGIWSKKQQCPHSTANTHKITTHPRQLQQYTRSTNNNYTQDNLKLATKHTRQNRGIVAFRHPEFIASMVIEWLWGIGEVVIKKGQTEVLGEKFVSLSLFITAHPPTNLRTKPEPPLWDVHTRAEESFLALFLVRLYILSCCNCCGSTKFPCFRSFPCSRAVNLWAIAAEVYDPPL